MKMKVAEQLAIKTVGTTKMRAKPTTMKVKAREARRPSSRQVVSETRRVVVAKATKRIRGRPARTACVARKAASFGLSSAKKRRVWAISLRCWAGSILSVVAWIVLPTLLVVDWSCLPAFPTTPEAFRNMLDMADLIGVRQRLRTGAKRIKGRGGQQEKENESGMRWDEEAENGLRLH